MPTFAVEDLIDPTVEISIPKASINEFPLCRYDGPIELVHDDAGAQRALEQLRRESVLGFDTESRPVFRRGQSYPPSLLQLAGADRVWLFQLQRMENLDPVFELLSDPAIIKAGVALRDDIKKLNEILPFKDGGFLEISAYTQKVGVVNTGLRSLSAIFLNHRISKGAQVSNWAKTHLAPAQITYAATDAWVSRQLYLRLRQLGVIPAPEAMA